MTPKQRVLAAFNKKPSDKVPVHHIGLCSQVAGALLGREAYVGGGIQQWREAVAWWHGEDAHAEFLERSFQDALDVALLLDQDIVRPSYWRYDLRPTKRLDDNTFLYACGDEDDWRVLRYDPPSEQCNVFPYSPRQITMDDLEKDIREREKAVADYHPSRDQFAFDVRAHEQLGDERVVRTGGVGIGIPVRESEIWFEALLVRPDLVERHLDIQTEQAIRNAEFLVSLGFVYLFGGGDFASNEGPMYSPEHFRRLVVPRLKRVSDACHKLGAYHLFASDGNVWPVADGLFGASGLDGYYEIDRLAGMDLSRLRRRFPDLTLLGNISSRTVHLGAREQVVQEALSCIEEAKRSSGIIVGVSNYLVPGTPARNVAALIETIRQHR
jgi:hypothetical protein